MAPSRSARVEEHAVPKSFTTHRFATTAVAALALVVGLVIAVPAATAHTAKSRNTAATSARPTAYTPPRIKHVWIITLENETYSYTFGTAGERQAPYLTKTLPAK